MKLIHDGKQTRLVPVAPVGAYFGIVDELGTVNTTVPKEADRF